MPKYVKLFEDHLENLQKLSSLGLLDDDGQKVLDYIRDEMRGDLRLKGSSITSLPDDLTVGGALDLRDTGIQSLPDDLTVGDSLYLSRTQIQSLPSGLKVGRDLYLNETPIQELPHDLQVGGEIRGFKQTRI